MPLMFLVRRWLRALASLPALILCFATPLPNLAAQSPQQPPGQSPPILTVNARLVVLDVVVTGKDSKPVNDLTEKDFQVFEDGKLQRIRSLERPSEHVLPQTSLAAGAAAVFDPAQPASFGHSSVNVLVLDQLNTHFADSSFARRSMHDYLAKQPALLPQPTTLLSVYDNQFQRLQNFTRDRDALLRALTDAPTKYAWKLEVNGKTDHGPVERLDQSLRALEQIAQSYASISGRKNLIWVGGGFPTLDPEALDGDNAREVKDTLQHITDVLLDTRITLYAIDPSSSAAGMTEITDASQMAFMQAAGDAATGGVDPFSDTDDFDKLGPLTGGRVIRGLNDIAQQIATAVDLGANFYTLTYTPDSISEAAAPYRTIKVVCLRAGLTVSTRNGYYSGQSQQEKSAATVAYDLTTAAEGSMPLNGLSVSVEPDNAANAPPNTYIVRVGAASLSWKPQGNGGSTASVYVMAVSLDAKNKMLGHTLHGMTANAGPRVDMYDASRLADFIFTAPPVPKTTALRFVVRDSATGRMGSVDLQVKNH